MFAWFAEHCRAIDKLLTIIIMQRTTIPLDEVKKHINYYPDWPKKGINFIDLLPLMSDADIFNSVIVAINSLITTPNVAAPEARGFLFATPLLVIDGDVHNFIPFRKSGKLPAAQNDLQAVDIVKEYGGDQLFFRKSDVENAQPTGDVIEVTVIDDILATGGTAEGMAQHLNTLRIERDGRTYSVRVKEFVFLADIGGLGGRERLASLGEVKCLFTL